MKAKRVPFLLVLFFPIIFCYFCGDNGHTNTDEGLPPVITNKNIKVPKLIKRVDAIIPEIARHTWVQGVVILEVTNDIYGRVKNVKVLRSTSPSIPILDQAFIDAVKQWIYEPLIICGKPREVIFTVTCIPEFKNEHLHNREKWGM